MRVVRLVVFYAVFSQFFPDDYVMCVCYLVDN